MKKGLKVLQVCAIDFSAKNLLLPLMISLKGNGYNVGLACKAGENYDFIKSQGIDFYDIPVARGYNLIKHIISIYRLCKLISFHKFDIVHSHTTAASLDGCIAAKLAKTPIILYTIHGLHITDNSSYVEKVFYNFVEKLKCKLSTFIFTQSEEDRIYAIKNKIVPPDKILTLGNGVDIDKFSLSFRERYRKEIRNELGIPHNSFVLTIVARLSKIKGHVELFKAIDLINKEVREDFYLLVVGDVTEDEPYSLRKEELLNIISNLSLRTRIIFTGMRDDVNKILAGTDVFVLPSFREGMPRSIIEAMAMGLPVIASNIGGCREEVVDNETGILVPPHDIESLASAIMKLYKNSKLRERMGSNGRKRAEQMFDERKVIEKEIGVFEMLLRQKNRL